MSCFPRGMSIMWDRRMGFILALGMGGATRKQARCQAPHGHMPQPQRTSRPVSPRLLSRGSEDVSLRHQQPSFRSWRTTADITLNWNVIMNIADDNEPWWRAAGPGGWNDPGAPARTRPHAPVRVCLTCHRHHRANCPARCIIVPFAADMLEIGNGKLSEDEERAHFSLWALMKAPLLIGCDVSKIPRRSFDVLTNAEACRGAKRARSVCPVAA